ncbi:NAD(P)H-dependent oxidoreductase [Sphingomonas sp. NFR15]|uniref:NAD(P)H-dependent oxidoreductase n=1 Tax=Sphingomonas sp. NFR15 TaxID=1566282 RepID=UPI00088141D3|nr:NAD(P)H-dependent oxidoreductase [Sphingomonas sp. NFR15]SDA36931.1 FMN-dependent NADH-azoreductase [Sphingomonas sp. NFR15]
MEHRTWHPSSRAVENLQRNHPSLDFVVRDLSALATATIPSSYAEAVVGGLAHDAEALVLSEELIRELEGAAVVVIATPMHDYTVPASLKMWIDFVLRYGRSSAPIDGAKTGPLKDRPTLVVVTAGGIVSGDGRIQPDYLTGYLGDVLSTVGIHDLRFVCLEASPVRCGPSRWRRTAPERSNRMQFSEPVRPRASFPKSSPGALYPWMTGAGGWSDIANLATRASLDRLEPPSTPSTPCCHRPPRQARSRAGRLVELVRPQGAEA